MDELTPAEVFLIIESDIEHDQTMIEAQGYAFKAALATMLQGKDIKVYGDKDEGHEVLAPEEYEKRKQAIIDKAKKNGVVI